MKVRKENNKKLSPLLIILTAYTLFLNAIFLYARYSNTLEDATLICHTKLSNFTKIKVSFLVI